MLYDSPCDVPGYYEKEYSEEYERRFQEQESYLISEYESRDEYDPGELLEVNWDSPR